MSPLLSSTKLGAELLPKVFFLPAPPFPQLISTARNCIIEIHNFVVREAKAKINDVPGTKVVLACGYTIPICLVVSARLRVCATQLPEHI
jgi:hypothetical protein